jgi:hypothetical protein
MTHRMPPLGGPGNTRNRGCITGRSSDLRTLQPVADFLLAVASQSFCIELPISAEITAFVFAYRCGAAPDSHRIPN